MARALSLLVFGLLTVAVSYAVFTGGGDAPFDSNIILLFVGLGGLFGSLLLFASDSRQSIDRVIDGTALLFPLYVALQLAPLPLAALRVLSPARAMLADAFGPIMGASRLAPITISAPTTWSHLARVSGCAIAFLTVRHLMRRFAGVRWWVVLPLIALGTLVSVLALIPASGVGSSGFYGNRNHFANLLAMLLPLAAGCAAIVLSRERRVGPIAVGDALKASALIGCAAAMFFAAVLSLSKMGALVALVSLLTMAMIAARGNVSRKSWWMLLPGVFLLVVAGIVFLTPPELVERLAVLATSDPTEGRMPIWRDAVHLVAAYPLFGVGLGNFYPAILRYQTFALDVAWVNAHNDYLQLFSELGLVGWLIPAALMSIAFWRALRLAIADVPSELRFLGLACVGALTAFLVHSTSEFNSYVLANALVLSLIVGVSTALPLMSARRLPAMQKSVPALTIFPTLVLVLSCFTVASSAAGLVLGPSLNASPQIERSACRFGVCDTEGALATFKKGSGNGVTAVPANEWLEYLRRDPADPNRWEDMGEALQREGRTIEARHAFSHAVDLAPRSPSILLMAADFHFDVGEPGPALDLVSRGLRGGGAIDRAAFADLEYRKTAVADILQYAVPDRRSAQAYLHHLVARDSTAQSADALEAWRWMTSHRYLDDALASEYVEFMIAKKEPQSAADGWASYAAGPSHGYLSANAVFNGGFESEPTGSRFDWKVAPPPSVSVAFNPEVRREGARSLRIQFDGTQNVGDLGLEETIYLPSGRYRFLAYVRTRDLSTNQGLRFRLITSDASRKEADAQTDDVRGTSEWTAIERLFDAPSDGLVRLLLVRQPSLKFDNLIRGTAWVDQVSVTRVG